MHLSVQLLTIEEYITYFINLLIKYNYDKYNLKITLSLFYNLILQFFINRLHSVVPILESDVCSDGDGICLANGKCKLIGKSNAHDLPNIAIIVCKYAIFFFLACVLCYLATYFLVSF